MVNPDSDLYRAHPDWVLGDRRLRAGARPPSARARPRPADAFEHVLGQLDALLARPRHRLRQVGHEPRPCRRSDAAGRAGAHAQTLALYRLIDELRARHPAVEIESCASGGARIDLGILATHRAGVDQRLQRCAGTPDDPALGVDADPAGGDGRAHRATAQPHDRAAHSLCVPRRHGDVRSPRHRVGPARRSTTPNSPASPRSSPRTAGIANCSTPVTSCASTAATTARSRTAWSPPTAPRRSWRWSASRRRPACCPTRCGSRSRPRALVRDHGTPARPCPLARRASSLTGQQLARHGLQPPVMNPESARLIHLAGQLTGQMTGRAST